MSNKSKLNLYEDLGERNSSDRYLRANGEGGTWTLGYGFTPQRTLDTISAPSKTFYKIAFAIPEEFLR